MKRFLGCCAVLSALAALAGCGQAPLDSVEASQQAVAFGDLSGPEDNGVLEVWGTSPSVIEKCSGSLVAENLVLTARHCVADFVDDTFSCTPDGELVEGSPGGKIGPPLDPSAISIRVGPEGSNKVAALASQVFVVQATSICRNDIAMVVLDRPLTGLPIVPMRLDSGNQPGEVLRVVGYGATDQNTIGERRTRSGIKISKVGTSIFRANGDAVPARTFMTQGPALCIGDSGGPALTENGAVTGVFSQFAGPCLASTARDFFTQVAPFKDDLVTPAFAAAKAQPILEAGGGAGGAPSDLPEAGAGDVSVGGDGNVAGGAVVLPGAGGGNVDDEPTYDAPRQPGGCKCRMGSAYANTNRADRELLLSWLVCGAVFARRTRRSRARRVP